MILTFYPRLENNGENQVETALNIGERTLSSITENYKKFPFMFSETLLIPDQYLIRPFSSDLIRAFSLRMNKKDMIRLSTG